MPQKIKEKMKYPKPKEKIKDWEKEFDKFLLYDFDSFNKKKTETHRWLFCWDGQQDNEMPFDCACCVDGIDHSKDKEITCGCICHKRIEQLKSFIRQLLSQENQKAYQEGFAKAIELEKFAIKKVVKTKRKKIRGNK